MAQSNGPIKIHVTGRSAYPGDIPNSYVMTTEPKTGLLAKVAGQIGNAFMSLLPDKGGQATTTDTSLVIKTSPTIWEYEQFRLEWDRRAVLREIDMMLREDPRVKRANRTFAETATRKGVSVTVSSTVSDDLAERAQDIINDLMRDCQINSKLSSWARILLKDGDLFLNPVIDVDTKRIKTIKRLPAISMQRNDDMMGNFQDLEAAFRQIDPISLSIIDNFPLWAVNHIRYDHEEGDRYGSSQYLQARGYWKKLKMTEEDLVIRRRTRAIPRRLHTVGNKDNPGGWADVQNYRAQNHLDGRTSQITTDYYGNGLTDIKNLDGDAHLDAIKDIEHLQEVYMIGTGVPLHMLGFGRNVNRDIVEDQIKQFQLDTQELRDLLEFGDSSPYSGLRFIFDFALSLQDIDPSTVDYNVAWYANDTDSAQDRIARVVALRSMEPKPLISQKRALQLIARDINLETQSAIEAEIEEIDREVADAPTVPAAPMRGDASIVRAVEDAVQARKKKRHPLRTRVVERYERRMARDLRAAYRAALKAAKHNLDRLEALHNHLEDDSHRKHMVRDVVDIVRKALRATHSDREGVLFRGYNKMHRYALERVRAEFRGVMTDAPPHDALIEWANPRTSQYLQERSATLVRDIDATTLELLRRGLERAYTQGENVAQWIERIEAVVECESPRNRAEMIARTELSWAYTDGALSAYREIGMPRVQLLAIMDNRTCELCAEAHERIFPLAEAENLAPRHPNCRCTFVGVWDGLNSTPAAFAALGSGDD